MNDISFLLFFVFCFLHLCLSIGNSWWRDNSFQISILINTIPFVLYSQLSQNELRFYGVPYGYFPIIASSIPYIGRYLRGGFVKKKDFGLRYPFMIFLVYCAFSLLLSESIVETIPYFISWVLNIFLFLSVFHFFKNKTFDYIQENVEKFVNILILCCCIGILKFIMGISLDANFMPLFNRNATLVFICTLIPLIPALWAYGRIGLCKFVFYMMVIFIVIVFIESRSGLIATIYAITFSIYAAISMKLKNKKIAIAIIAVMAFSAMLVITNSNINERLGYLKNTTEVLVGGGTIDQGEQDFDRAMLLSFAFEIIELNPFFGVGIGLRNYQLALESLNIDFHRLSKAHNFYVSYFAELGMVGFSILLFGFYRLYKIVKNNIFCSQAYVTCAILLFFNEYILLPELWYLLGLISAYAFKFYVWKNER